MQTGRVISLYPAAGVSNQTVPASIAKNHPRISDGSRHHRSHCDRGNRRRRSGVLRAGLYHALG